MWTVVKNEDKQGSNPYTQGYKQIAKEVVERKRDFSKERQISPIPFNNNCRATKASDDKAKVQSLN